MSPIEDEWEDVPCPSCGALWPDYAGLEGSRFIACWACGYCDAPPIKEVAHV